MNALRPLRPAPLLVAVALALTTSVACSNDDDSTAPSTDDPEAPGSGIEDLDDEPDPSDPAPPDAPDDDATSGSNGQDDDRDDSVDSDDTSSDADADGPTMPPPIDCVGESDGVLTFGTLLPSSGDLSYLAPAMIASTLLAADDINTAGGVLGTDVVVHQGNSGDVSNDLADDEVARLLALDTDVIIGAASSAVSFGVIDTITRSCVIQFSPANTSPLFSTYDDGGLYFRTAASDAVQGRVLADLVLADGSRSASVIFRRDPYGVGLADQFRTAFEDGGGTIDESVVYEVGSESFDSEVDLLVAAGSDAVVVIGFAESAAILSAMHDSGIGPLDARVYGTDGNISGLGGLVDPGILVGMRGTEPWPDPDRADAFGERLDSIGDMSGIVTYGASTYDAVVIVALAAVVAGTDAAHAVAAEINEVTRGPGVDCDSFEACAAELEAGSGIRYIGIGGPYDFAEVGEPSVARFRIATYDGGSTPNPALDEFASAG